MVMRKAVYFSNWGSSPLIPAIFVLVNAHGWADWLLTNWTGFDSLLQSHLKNGIVAPTVERESEEFGVIGSNPIYPAKKTWQVIKSIASFKN